MAFSLPALTRVKILDLPVDAAPASSWLGLGAHAFTAQRSCGEVDTNGCQQRPAQSAPRAWREAHYDFTVFSRLERHVAAIVFYLEIVNALVSGPFTDKLTKQRAEDILSDSHTGRAERLLALVGKYETLGLAARPDLRPPEILLVRSKIES